MERYRIIAAAVFLAAIIQSVLSVFVKLSGMIGEPESTWVLIALIVTAALDVGISVWLLIKSNR